MGEKTEMVGVTFHPCNHPIAELDTSLLPNIFFFYDRPALSSPPTTIHQLYHTSSVVDGTAAQAAMGTGHGGCSRSPGEIFVVVTSRTRRPSEARSRSPRSGEVGGLSGLVGTSASPLLTGRPEFSNLGTALRPCRCDVRDGHPKMLWIARRSGTLGGHLTHDRCFHERRCRTGARPCLARKELIDLAGAWTCGALRLCPLDRVG